ncbi:MAG: hypothetical protein WDZ58_03475, partial [Gemmatimonadaceae bacterium]
REIGAILVEMSRVDQDARPGPGREGRLANLRGELLRISSARDERRAGEQSDENTSTHGLHLEQLENQERDRAVWSGYTVAGKAVPVRARQ